MPYIAGDTRDALLAGSPPIAAGELNFLITKMCLAYLTAPHAKPDYSSYNEVVGVLECVKLEFYRRAVAWYEDDKRVVNGDVYPTKPA